MALLLKSKGYGAVWPLQGGFDAWLELGYPTQTLGGPQNFPTGFPTSGSSAAKEQDNSWA